MIDQSPKGSKPQRVRVQARFRPDVYFFLKCEMARTGKSLNWLLQDYIEQQQRFRVIENRGGAGL